MLVKHFMQSYNRYLIALFFASLSSLVLSVVVYEGHLLIQILYGITYLVVVATSIFIGKVDWLQPLMRAQIYFIAPTIISYAVSPHFGLVGHLLYYLQFSLLNIICLTELTKRGSNIVRNKEWWRYLAYGGGCSVSICGLAFFLHDSAIILYLITSFFVYLLTFTLIIDVKKRALPRINPLYVSRACYIGLLVTTILLYFTRDYTIINMVGRAAYVVMATYLFFYHKKEKIYLTILSMFLVLTHFLPVHGAYYDYTIIAVLSLLLHMPESKLYEMQTEFGKLSIKYKYLTNEVVLYNNDILHGEQYYEGNKGYISDFWYYGNTKNKGPIREILEKADIKGIDKNVAMVGLGLGAMSSYGKPGQNITFYELNPVVKEIASDQNYFTFLSNCKANLSYVIGDARKTLVQAKDGEYGIILVDAYSGKYVPKCFLTVEALKLYFKKLHKDGLLIIHITTGEKGIESILAKVTTELGLSAYITFIDDFKPSKDLEYSNDGMLVFKNPQHNWLYNIRKFVTTKILNQPFGTRSGGCLSQWVVVATDEKRLRGAADNKVWNKLIINPGQELITDATIGYQ